MNQALQTLLNRRSIRKYKPEQIKSEELQSILEAGKFAPSGMNRQPWHFTVVQNQEILRKINEICRAAFLASGNPTFAERAKAESFSVYYHAPTLIIVSADEKAHTAPFDCALALGNMFNAAESLGIGSCWIHAIKSAVESEEGKALRQQLGIPEGYVVYGSGAFGYKGETPNPAPRKEDVVNIVK